MNVLPVLLMSVVAFIAGHPTQIACDANTNVSPVASSGAVVDAWTLYGGNVIHAQPFICDELGAPVGSRQFAVGLATMIHEAAHARGVRNESCAELTADLGIYQVLRDFYGIPFFSKESVAIGAMVLANTRQRPAEYQPEGCWNSAYG